MDLLTSSLIEKYKISLEPAEAVRTNFAFAGAGRRAEKGKVQSASSALYNSKTPPSKRLTQKASQKKDKSIKVGKA